MALIRRTRKPTIQVVGPALPLRLLAQHNLSFEERERIAYVSDFPLYHDMDEYEALIGARGYQDVAEDFPGIGDPEDLRKRLVLAQDFEAVCEEFNLDTTPEALKAKMLEWAGVEIACEELKRQLAVLQAKAKKANALKRRRGAATPR